MVRMMGPEAKSLGIRETGKGEPVLLDSPAEPGYWRMLLANPGWTVELNLTIILTRYSLTPHTHPETLG